MSTSKTKYSKKKLIKYMNGNFDVKALKFRHEGSSYELKYKPEVANVDSTDISQALQVSPYQSTHFNIVGLKDPETLEKHLFRQKQNLPWCKVLSKDVTLRDDIEYELLVNDRRQIEWEVLDEEDKQDIDKEFDVFDTDRSGFVTVEEAIAYFRNQEEKNLADAEKYYNEQIENAEEEIVKEDLNNKLKKYQASMLNMIDNQIEVFFQSADINQDGKVSRCEWQLVKANQKVSLNKSYEERIQQLLQRQEEKRALEGKKAG